MSEIQGNLNKFSPPLSPQPAIPSKPQIILAGFGLSGLRAAIYSKRTEPSDKPKLANSYLGVPVFDEFTFEAGNYTINGNSIAYLDSPLILTTVLIEVTIGKIIIKTAIQGRDGTVKEYISIDDYRIDIRGMIASQHPNVYPRDEVQRLIKVIQAPCALKVTSAFLSIFGITEIVIDPEASLPQMEGQRNTQLFRITALSDAPIELSSNV